MDAAKQALSDCETRLRELLSEAAKAGDYENVERLTAWAKAIRALASGVSINHLDNSSARSRRSSKASARKPANKRRSTERYPKFARFKEDLVKIGWSRREKKEYQHRAPRRVARLLAKQLMKTFSSGGIFSTDQIFPLHDDESNADVPSYQCYVCLAWFRDRKLVEQVGRQGYRLLSSENLDRVIDREWDQLPIGNLARRGEVGNHP
jgi:hypothetical protein